MISRVSESCGMPYELWVLTLPNLITLRQTTLTSMCRLRLIEQGIDSFKDLSPRKLRAIQLALGLVERKLPKTLALVKNRWEAKLAGLKAQLPNNL